MTNILVGTTLIDARVIGVHVGSPMGFAAYPLDQPKPVGGTWEATSHDVGCCASRTCHKVCSHLCGTDLHICDGTPHPDARP